MVSLVPEVPVDVDVTWKDSGCPTAELTEVTPNDSLRVTENLEVE